jgi:hypothetical protein
MEVDLKKSEMKIQMQYMYLHVNQGQAEYNNVYGIVAFLKNVKCKDIKIKCFLFFN